VAVVAHGCNPALDKRAFRGENERVYSAWRDVLRNPGRSTRRAKNPMSKNGLQYNQDEPEIPVETLAETENYTIWSADEPDGETTYHLELGPVTVHFFMEEWDEFLAMVRLSEDDLSDDDDDDQNEDDDEEDVIEIELDWGVLFFDTDEWEELQRLIERLD
jgi:hypothetical protein